MELRSTNNKNLVLSQIDWFTVILYTILVFSGWVSIYAASYDFDNASIFDFTERSGKQLLWIGLSFFIGMVIMLLDMRIYETYAYLVYIIVIGLLVLTIFIAPDIKGSESWIKLGPINLQSAEFAKFATALALAKLFSGYNFKLKGYQNYGKALLIMFLPALLILMQKETGTALVFCAMIFVLYRLGMSGLVIFGGICAIVYFVITLKFGDILIGNLPLGELIVLIIILLVAVGLIIVYCKNFIISRNLLIFYLVCAAVCITLSLIEMELPYLYIFIGIVSATLIYLILIMLHLGSKKLLHIICITLASILFMLSVNYVFNNVMEHHQQMRIKVALGIEDDLRGAGYNVNQSKIAIGSGGFMGKGFLNGTQTKLKYVPEQDTDFIFCTIGEEEGFCGATIVIILFTILILRLIFIAERQRTAFGLVYGYCVVSILFFHLAVNIGMVIGLCPVIGIPLPFFSYGGSSLWGCTILLFILLRIDASRKERS